MRDAHRRPDDVVDWTVLKSIQEANAASMRAMEQYLLFVTRPDETVGSTERTRALLERSITHHRAVIEQLEVAVSEIETAPATTDTG
jgi:hypothetical protein